MRAGTNRRQLRHDLRDSAAANSNRFTTRLDKYLPRCLASGIHFGGHGAQTNKKALPE
ncbi:MAG TPA: hypothetical protein VGA87_05535 [Pyrinomonadaceae bacterium]|jgi:hypothetical protein